MSCGGITFGDYEQEHDIDTCGSSGSSVGFGQCGGHGVMMRDLYIIGTDSNVYFWISKAS